jgi:hypothetical protein
VRKEKEEKNRGKSSEVANGSRAKHGSRKRYTLERSKEVISRQRNDHATHARHN